MKKKVKCKISHVKSEKKGEFGSPWSGLSRFKEDTPIMLGPNKERKEKKEKRKGKKKVKRKKKEKKQKPSTYDLQHKTQNLLQPCNTLNKKKKRMKTRALIPFYSQ